MIENYKELLDDLNYFGVISATDVRTIRFIEEQNPNSENAFKALVTYFCFLQDGSTCLTFDKNLKSRFINKWNGLKEKRFCDETENSKAKLSDADSKKAQNIEEFFSGYFDNPEEAINSIQNFEDIFYFEKSTQSFYAKKYYSAKESIKDSIKKLFKNVKNENSENFLKIQNKYRYKFNGKDFALKMKQAEAIVKGQSNNLIITGGPGTGKTTVVFFLLLELLQEAEFENHWIYLTAPSGKAADRLKESILDSCKSLESILTKTCDIEAIQKIKNAENSTIHRLLKYRPSNNSFSYNSENQFNKNSIFIIDEASMIDVTLFSKLLEAIPAEAKVFILGDKDQLPSVGAGAVLEELLKINQNATVELNESNRFDKNSTVGRLALAMQKANEQDVFLEVENWKDFIELKNISDVDIAGEENLNLISYKQDWKYKEKKELLEKSIKVFSSNFFAPPKILDHLKLNSEEDLNKIKSGENKEVLDDLNLIWKWAKRGRILAAERRGIFGIENINQIIFEQFKPKRSNYFSGQFLMITKNQSALDLFNGDSGIVIMVGNEPYLMLEKSNSNGSFCKFSFYRLDLIPNDAYELAYAITVHKSQGSGYDHILFFLPENPDNLLANRQILYTGITRIQKGVLTLVGSKKIFESCFKNRLERFTGINL